MDRILHRFDSFLFVRRSDLGLFLLRSGLAAIILYYCLSLRHDWIDLYRSEGEGIVSRDLTEAILNATSVWIPRLGWLVSAGQHVGLSEISVLNAVWWLMLGSAVGLLFGLTTRECAMAAWCLHLCSIKSNALISYGADNFVTIGCFYLMLAPLPDHLSADFRWRKIALKNNRSIGFFQRVLQLHLSLIYLFGGVGKLFGTGWWNGDSIWRALTRPPFNVLSPQLLISWRGIFPVVSVTICLLEAGYPVGMWWARTRRAWLVAIIVMHIAIGLTMGLYFFALIMIVLNLAAFAPEFSAVQRKHEITRY